MGDRLRILRRLVLLGRQYNPLIAAWVTGRLVPHNRTVQVTLPGYHSPIMVRTGESDLDVFDQIFVDNHYRVATKEPHFIADLGANVGYSSIYFARNFPEALIVAVEPDLSNYALLCENTRSYPNVRPINAAVWKDNRSNLGIVNPTDDRWAIRVGQVESDQGAVPTITLEDVQALNPGRPIDLLKMDIEGAEYEVFAEGDCHWLDRVGTIMIELHDRLRPGCSHAFYQQINRYTYAQWIVGENLVVELQH